MLKRNINSIFSESKPLNENLLDQNFIYATLNTLLASFDLDIHINRVYWFGKWTKIMFFVFIFSKVLKKLIFQVQKSIFRNFWITIPGAFWDASGSRTHSGTTSDPSRMIWINFTKMKFFDFFEFFWLEKLWFWAFSRISWAMEAQKIHFSKSKPLNENRLDQNFILVPLNTLLALFDLAIHIKRAYWIWK